MNDKWHTRALFSNKAFFVLSNLSNFSAFQRNERPKNHAKKLF